MAETLSDPLVGAFAGSYRIGALLGAGGMGRVYRAEHPELGKAAAVKVLAQALVDDADLVRRFRVEAQAVARLRHPNIVEVLDFGSLPDGRPFYTMELLHGESLHHLMRRRGTLPVDALVAILDPVLAALDVAHAAGIVHRDLKPENVFLALEGDHWVPKLLDFGVAKLVDGPLSAQTQTGSLLGTPQYMSPEQAVGQSVRIGPASDLYAVGVMAFEMLTGQLPFPAAHLGELIHAHLTRPAPRLHERRPDLPEALDELVASLLAKQPEDRPGSAQEVRRALLALAPAPGATLVGLVGEPRMATGSGKLSIALGSGVEPPPTRLQATAPARPPRRWWLAAIGAAAGAGLAVVLLRPSPAPVVASAPDAAVVPMPVPLVDAAMPVDAAPFDASPPARPRPRPKPAASADQLVVDARQSAAGGDWAGARRFAEEALRVDPGHQEARYLAVQGACMARDAAAAKKHYARIDDETFRRGLDELCVRFGRVYLSEASAGSIADKQTRATELYPKAIEAVQKDPALALKLGEEIIALYPTFDGGHLVAAQAACKLGKPDLVAKHLAKVPERLRDLVGMVCQQAGTPMPTP